MSVDRGGKTLPGSRVGFRMNLVVKRCGSVMWLKPALVLGFVSGVAGIESRPESRPLEGIKG